MERFLDFLVTIFGLKVYGDSLQTERVERDQHWMAGLMALTIVGYACYGLALGSMMANGSILFAIIVALSAGGLSYAVLRNIVTMDLRCGWRSWLIYAINALMMAGMSLIAVPPVGLTLYERQIEQRISFHEAEALYTQNARIRDLTSEIERLQAEVDEAQAQLMTEIRGAARSGRPGFGVIARDHRIERDEKQVKLNEILNERNNEFETPWRIPRTYLEKIHIFGELFNEGGGLSYILIAFGIFQLFAGGWFLVGYRAMPGGRDTDDYYSSADQRANGTPSQGPRET